MTVVLYFSNLIFSLFFSFLTIT